MGEPNTVIESEMDRDQLRLLAIFHYVVGGLTALFACFPLVHVSLGIAMLVAPDSLGHPPSRGGDQLFAYIFVVMGAMFFLIGQAMAICILLSARFIRQRRRHTFVFVTACVQCIFFPFGTVLGIFTIIVLSRTSVRHAFGLDATPPAG